jgi:hypothetical protein
MQLTANFVVLATALAYGSTSVLALPVDSSFATREVEYEVEARDASEVSYNARALPELTLDSRSFFGAEEDLEARAQTPLSATTPVSAKSVSASTPVSAKSVSGSTPVTPVSSKIPVTPASGFASSKLSPKTPSTRKSTSSHHLTEAEYNQRFQADLSNKKNPAHAWAEKTLAFDDALYDPMNPNHKSAEAQYAKTHPSKARKAELKAALKDPKHPKHAAAKKALRKHAKLSALKHKESLIAKHDSLKKLSGARKLSTHLPKNALHRPSSLRKNEKHAALKHSLKEEAKHSALKHSLKKEAKLAALSKTSKNAKTKELLSKTASSKLTSGAKKLDAVAPKASAKVAGSTTPTTPSTPEHHRHRLESFGEGREGGRGEFREGGRGEFREGGHREFREGGHREFREGGREGREGHREFREGREGHREFREGEGRRERLRPEFQDY